MSTSSMEPGLISSGASSMTMEPCLRSYGAPSEQPRLRLSGGPPSMEQPGVRSSRTSNKGGEAQHYEVICNMLAMLNFSEKQDANRALLSMTNSPESCQSLRRAGCIPLLIQILHPCSSTPIDSHPSLETKRRASEALQKIVRFNPDEQMKRKEVRILRSLEAIRGFASATTPAEQEKHPTRSSTNLMRHSFDGEHKKIMCTLGSIHAFADLIIADHRFHGRMPGGESDCILTRRYSCMALTNLTFRDQVNKALLCTMNEFLTALVAQLEMENEDIVQVTASVLRNLSWHADSGSIAALSEAHSVSALTRAALRATKEPTLKATLSALWNLSAHSDLNKAAICSTPNALQFLLSLLQKPRSKSVMVVESAGGILRNASSYISAVEAHRITLLECHCYEILLDNLKSPSMIVVSNTCGALWNLSTRPEEQRKLLELNAVPMLKSLIYSKDDRISQGANATLRNILSSLAQPADARQNIEQELDQPLDLTITSCKSSPVRKKNPPPFLNPPLCNGSYGSVSATRSCPDIQVKTQQQQQQQQKLESSSDETYNYSHYDEEEEEEEKHQQKDTVKTYCDEGTPGFSGSMVDLSNQADTCIQFQVEDTPAIFSRTSSLSSIEENQHGENEAEKILEAQKPSPVLVASGSSLPNSTVVVPKRVMFSAEETPLMFSRCSSVASLESCGDLNNGRCESDCVSEFSRRTSEVVSPSELPDSPRATDQNSSPPEPPREPNETDDFIEEEPMESKAKPNSSTHDEVKVFAMEGTPFLISTATSLSDIVGELDNQLTSQIIMEEPPAAHPAPQVVNHQQRLSPPPAAAAAAPESQPQPEDDPIYSDVQLLQKCIRAGRGLGIPKIPPVAEEEEVDLSCLIQRGRAKLLTRSEDNLKQYTTSSSSAQSLPQVPPVGPPFFQSRSNNNGEISFPSSKPPNLGSLPSLNQNQRFTNINMNIVAPTVHEPTTTMNIPTDNIIKAEDNKAMERIVTGTRDLKLGPFPPQMYSPNANSILSSPSYGNDTDSVTTFSTVKQNFANSLPDDNDNTDSLSEDTTWTDETPTFSSPIPSMSISKAMKKVAGAVEETLSEIEQPTLDSLGTLDSTGLHTGSLQRQLHQKQLQLLQTSSSQVSNLMNQKPPPEFFDLDSSMISVASIKSEIFEDGFIPSSPQLSTSSSHAQPQAIPQHPNSNHHHHYAQVAGSPSPPGVIPVPVPTPPQTKFDTFVVKRMESPKERRKNDPERYLTRTIEKADLKMKPPVPPKPSSATSVVRPTRASELRATRSREHSPTNSTTSLNTTTSASAAMMMSGGGKVPPKPPVRSTPPLNTTLPRNAKLMEGHHSSNLSTAANSASMDSMSGGGSRPPPLPQSLPPPPTSTTGKDAQHKLNFGGRIGNLFRKSFSKDGGKKKEGNNIWVKRREKALVPPYNYKPPGDQGAGPVLVTTTMTLTPMMATTPVNNSTSNNGNATNVNNIIISNNTAPSTNGSSNASGNPKSSSKITTV